MKKIRSRDELQKLLSVAQQLKQRGQDVRYAEIERLVCEYYSWKLQEVTHGRGTDEDVIDLVGHHWPYLSKSQEMVVDYWQARLIRHILEGRNTNMKEVFVKGCTGAGKGGATAIAACLWYETGPECKVIVTSDTASHAERVMFGEIARFRKRMKYACRASHGAKRIGSSESKYMQVVNPESPESFSGQHSVATLILFDEASGCPESLWNQAETQAKMCVALSNPRPNSSWFKRGFPAGDPDETKVIEIPGGRRSLITVGGQDCINVKRGRVVIPAQITREKYEAIKARRHPPWWGRVMGDGRFSDEAAARILIPARWLQRHTEAWHKQIPVTAFGLDVARSESGDRTVLAAGSGAGCLKLHELQTVSTMDVVGWALHQAETYGIELKAGTHAITVDMDGLGSGVGDRLKEQGVWVLEYRGNASSTADPKTYANLRAEGYGELSKRLDPDGAWPDDAWALPRDMELLEELSAPERVYASDGIRFRITPKTKPNASYKGETIHQSIGRSPDKADAVVYLHYAVREGGRWDRWRRNEKAPIIASGQNPERENRILTDEEVEMLPESVRELLKFARKYKQDLDDD